MSNFFYLFLILSNLTFATDLKTFCFQNGRDLIAAQSEIKSLFVGNDKVISRTNTPCMEVISDSSLRLELFEKFLSRRFKLDASSTFSQSISESNENCRIQFIETRKKISSEEQVKVGENTKLKKGHDDLENKTTQEFLVQPTKPLTFQSDKLKLDLICRRLNENNFEITLSSLGDRGGVSTVLMLSRGVKVSLGTSLNDLNNKKKQLGYPESEWLNIEGNESINYELFIP